MKNRLYMEERRKSRALAFIVKVRRAYFRRKNTKAAHVTISNWPFVAFGGIWTSGSLELYQSYLVASSFCIFCIIGGSSFSFTV